jgi:TPR repeat protein
MYLNGYGLMMNDSKALEWWQRSSDQGYTDASFSIAMLYSLGEGQVDKDMDKAIDYYLMAVEDGHEDANMIIRSMLARDDKSIRQRKQEIVRTYGYLLGPLFDVRVERANLRRKPSLESKIVTVLNEGDAMVELSDNGKWMQVGLLKTGEVAWIYKSLLQPHVLTNKSF